MYSVHRRRHLERAQEALAAGRHRRALSRAWKALRRAIASEDRSTAEAVVALAGSLVTHASGRTADDARRLHAFASACLSSGSGRLKTPSALGRLIERD
jgi:hypothetical protein